jgi:molybdopterin molybdotransferase
MISCDEAIARLLAATRRLPGERCAVADAATRVLADAVASRIALPSFDHAAMDGYALGVRGTLDAGSEHAVAGSVAAGDEARDAAPGDAWEIMTGAPLPDGANAVVPVENTQATDSSTDGAPLRIRLRAPLGEGDNVRRAGSDVMRSDIVLASGQRIDAAQIMLLAAIGTSEVLVVRRPRVAIIGTGKELVADPSQPLAGAQIHASNGPYLAAALAAAGAQVLSNDVVDDTAVTYADAVRRAVAAGADLVVSTGAVSMGRYDFVPDALRELGATTLFHKVAMRPGKPLLAATLRDGPLVIALPGTPMAVAAGLRFFIAPVLRAMLGQGVEPTLHAVLDTPQQPKAGLRHFLRATFHLGDDGRLHAQALPKQQPFRIAPFAQADGWIVLGEDAGDCEAGRVVQVASLVPETGLPLRAAESKPEADE